MFSFPTKLLVTLSLLSPLRVTSASTILRTRNSSGVQPIALTGVSLANVLQSGPSTSIQDFKDIAYLANVVIGGQPFTVTIDTGSSDLWVLPADPQSIQLTQTTNFPLVESYGIGQASGTIEFAQVEFAGFTIPSQAFMIATATQDMFCSQNSGVCDGIIGLAFQDSFSALNAEIRQQTDNANNDDGANAIFNIFAQNPDVPTFFDMQLSRANDLEGISSGSFIVGSHVNGYEKVGSQPQLPVLNPGRWAVPLDQMSVNGKAFQFAQSVVSDVPSGKILVDIDSGFTFPPIPPAAVDFIYSSIPGAVVDNGTWIVPCDGTTDLKFTFGDVDFPIHYLDLTQVNTKTFNTKGQDVNVTYCSNVFVYHTPSADDGLDANIGDPFMRNAYISFNYNGLTTSGDGSFIQMLPTTDLNAALPDFQSSRSKMLSSMPRELSPSDFVALSQGLDIDDLTATFSATSGALPTSTTSGATESSAAIGSSNTASSATESSATNSVSSADTTPTESSVTKSASSVASTPTDSGSGGQSKNTSSSLRSSVINLLAPLFIITFTVAIP